ncbi:glutathione S-transferase family protein [Marinobacter sp. X15-166B]|uniref:glutathione S-transferase family protein n=1 Tax=Marinobacter sp. X15-166B TaxID=1897620 RepID=UPI00085C58CF|nr:glutathione S-transferase family protein [Marinobacter sp. X15-166B]OEY65478.1 glutathione S-transferase [Marinobacter sp. X15-166B]
MKLVIGNKNYSSWSLRPWLFMSVHELPFEEVRIPLNQDDTHTMLSRHTDAGKVPVLEDGDLVIWDSLAICEYISEQYLQGGGWPSSVRARAEARSCSAEMHSGFPVIRGELPMNCRATGRKVLVHEALEREVARIDQIWSRYRNTYSGAGPWLFGEFSIADCMFAPVASRFQTYGVNVSAASSAYMQLILGHEHMAAWVRQAHAEPEIIDVAEVGL